MLYAVNKIGQGIFYSIYRGINLKRMSGHHVSFETTYTRGKQLTITHSVEKPLTLISWVNEKIQDGKPILDPKYYANIDKNDMKDILRGDEGTGEIPLLDERMNNLREAGLILTNKYQGTFVECVKASSGSAEKLLKLITDEFQSFRDEANYENHRVSLYKRAQILIGDIWACFGGKDLGSFDDIDYLTMFADYRVPQVLIHFGSMRYSDSLFNQLQSGNELKNGSPEETEIRGCSIEIVERVKNKAKTLINNDPELKSKVNLNSIMIDHFLWDYRREHAEELESIPFHKTRTIFY